MIARRTIAALVSGMLFGLGLAISGMLDPARVRGFLDVTGKWDPSLAFVLGGAVIVAMVGVRLSRRLKHPLLDAQFHGPARKAIDAPLIVGSAIFGIGWGIGGFCPGPAVASLTLGFAPTAVFVATMLIGMIVHDRLSPRLSASSRVAGRES